MPLRISSTLFDDDGARFASARQRRDYFHDGLRRFLDFDDRSLRARPRRMRDALAIVLGHQRRHGMPQRAS